MTAEELKERLFNDKIETALFLFITLYKLHIEKRHINDVHYDLAVGTLIKYE